MDGEQDQQAGTPRSEAPAAPIGLLSKLTGARPEELPLVLTAILCAFCLFCGYSLAKPLRDAVSVGMGKEWRPWMLTGTLIAMLIATAVVGLMVSKLGWKRFALVLQAIWALGAFGFAVCFRIVPADSSKVLDAAFFTGVSVFNLLSLSVFWATASSIFSSDRAKALFPAIGIGVTLGGLVGPGLVTNFSGTFHASTFIFVSTGLVTASAACFYSMLSRLDEGDTRPNRSVEGSISAAVEGMRLALTSGYLGRIALYLLLYSVTGTLLWMQQQNIIEAATADLGKEAARDKAQQISGRIDLYANILAAALQFLVAGRILGMIGVSAALALTPLTTLASLWLLYYAPSVAVLTTVQVAKKGVHYAIDRPAREVLYTVVTPRERYKSKNFIDTFVYRFGDASGGWMEPQITELIAKYGIIASLIAFGTLCLGFAGIGVSLGQSLRKRESAK